MKRNNTSRYFVGYSYFRLFVTRESSAVLGKRYCNLWLLTAVLTLTFFAISFSNASLDYLSYKMDDPFINWVDIKNEYGEGDFYGLENALQNESLMQEYHYGSYQSDYYFTYMFYGKSNDNIQYLKCRFFQDMNTSLVEAILSEDNVVNNWRIPDLAELSPNTVGMIITEETMKKLGFSRAPAFIDYQRYSPGADEYGFDLYDGFVRVPVPVLAVVRRLPGNVDVISGTYFFQQDFNDMTYPFNLCKDEYAGSLSYFISDDIELSDFEVILSEAASVCTGSRLDIDEYGFWCPEIVSFMPGRFITVESDGGYMSYDEWSAVNKYILAEYRNKNVYRVYNYDFCDYPVTSKSYISVHFTDLDKIREFENYVRDTFRVKIEMSQIVSKENFNAVSLMGNALSWGIIVFAIVCIILFCVNMLVSYFHKVKKNLGTFRAFGIRNRELANIYVAIILAMIAAAIVMSISTVWLIQGVLAFMGILKDGLFGLLSLWSAKTLWAIVIIIGVSVCTVYTVILSLLKSTPGDLVYDRQ